MFKCSIVFIVVLLVEISHQQAPPGSNDYGKAGGSAGFRFGIGATGHYSQENAIPDGGDDSGAAGAGFGFGGNAGPGGENAGPEGHPGIGFGFHGGANPEGRNYTNGFGSDSN